MLRFPPMKSSRLASVLLTFTCLALPVQATPADHGDIARAIPADVSMFIRSQPNPERAFLDAHFAEVIETFKNSGVIETVLDIAKSNIPEGEQEEIGAVMGQIHRFTEMVDWMSLVEGDFVFSMKMEFPTPGYVVASRPPEGKYAAAIKGLQNILTEVQKFQPDTFVLETATREGADVMALSFGSQIPIEICIAGHDGTIFLTTSTEDLRNSIDLYNGKGGKALIDDPSFKEGMGKLPAFEDSQSYFNINSFLDGYHTMLKKAFAQNENEETAAILKVVSAGLDQFRIVQYVAGVGITDGNKTINESYTRLSPQAKSLPFYQAFADQDTFSDYHTLVPRDVTSFSLNSGANLQALYNMVASFVTEKVPNGKDLLTHFDTMQSQWGINIEKDVLSWISGETIAFSMPAGGGGMMGGMGGESVTMIKVSDAETGKKTIERGLTAAQQMLKQFGQTLIVAPASDAGENYRKITFPMMPFIQPVIGFEGDYMVIATSGKALAAMRAVKAGKAPSVLENEKFKSLGINPNGPVSSISFTDQSATYQGLAQAISMVPMIAGMALQGDDPQMKIARDCVNILPLLAPVIEKFDFHLATSGYTVNDDMGSYSKMVNSYRKDTKENDDL